MVLWSVSKLFVLMSIFAVFATVSSKPSRLSRMSAVARSSPTTAPSKPLKQFNMRTASKRARNVAAQPEASPSISNFVSSNLKVDGRINTGTLSSPLSNAAADVLSSVPLSGLAATGATTSANSVTLSTANDISTRGLGVVQNIAATASGLKNDINVQANTSSVTNPSMSAGIPVSVNNNAAADGTTGPITGSDVASTAVSAIKEAFTDPLTNAAQLLPKDAAVAAAAAQPAIVVPQLLQVDVQTNNGASSAASTNRAILVVTNGDSTTTNAAAASPADPAALLSAKVIGTTATASSASSAQPATLVSAKVDPANANAGTVDNSNTGLSKSVTLSSTDSAGTSTDATSSNPGNVELVTNSNGRCGRRGCATVKVDL